MWTKEITSEESSFSLFFLLSLNCPTSSGDGKRYPDCVSLFCSLLVYIISIIAVVRKKGIRSSLKKAELVKRDTASTAAWKQFPRNGSKGETNTLCVQCSLLSLIAVSGMKKKLTHSNAILLDDSFPLKTSNALKEEATSMPSEDVECGVKEGADTCPEPLWVCWVRFRSWTPHSSRTLEKSHLSLWTNWSTS